MRTGSIVGYFPVRSSKSRGLELVLWAKYLFNFEQTQNGILALWEDVQQHRRRRASGGFSVIPPYKRAERKRQASIPRSHNPRDIADEIHKATMDKRSESTKKQHTKRATKMLNKYALLLDKKGFPVDAAALSHYHDQANLHGNDDIKKLIGQFSTRAEQDALAIAWNKGKAAALEDIALAQASALQLLRDQARDVVGVDRDFDYDQMPDDTTLTYVKCDLEQDWHTGDLLPCANPYDENTDPTQRAHSLGVLHGLIAIGTDLSPALRRNEPSPFDASNVVGRSPVSAAINAATAQYASMACLARMNPQGKGHLAPSFISLSGEFGYDRPLQERDEGSHAYSY